MKELEDEISNLDKQIKFKGLRRSEAEVAKKYKLCEEITEEIMVVNHEMSRKRNELADLKVKARKALWYARRKRSTSESTGTSDCEDSDLLSPASRPHFR